MSKLKLLSLVVLGLILTLGSVQSASISVQISGEGALNDSTIIAGKPFSADFYFTNDTTRLGFTIGFCLKSDDIKEIVHVADSGKGINEAGDIKAYNGWEDNSIWDMQGLFVVERNWDGKLADTIGFGGVSIKKSYEAHKKRKQLSLDLMIPTVGTFVIDSSYWPPSGKWLYAGPNQTSHFPEWGGPYKFEVVKEAPATKKE